MKNFILRTVHEPADRSSSPFQSALNFFLARFSAQNISLDEDDVFVFNAKSYQINVTSVAGSIFVYDGLALFVARGEANDIKQTALLLCFGCQKE